MLSPKTMKIFLNNLFHHLVNQPYGVQCHKNQEHPKKRLYTGFQKIQKTKF